MQKNPDLQFLKEKFFDACSLVLSAYQTDEESSEYFACSYKLDSLNILGRSAKKTPIKSGFFVTLWKRKSDGPIRPLESADEFDYTIVSVKEESNYGVFIFPKSTLAKNGVIKSSSKEGKRAFRLYPPWEKTNSKLAQKSQTWQQDYFMEIDSSKAIDCQLAKSLLSFR